MSSVAWYDIRTRGWLRDILILLHPPYTQWHLCYVAIGAALAPEVDWIWLLWTLLAFFLGMGIGAHCLDELKGRPLNTRIPGPVLWAVAVASVAGAIAIGAVVGVQETVWVIPCMVFGGFIVFAYNLEWFGGRFHTDPMFGIAWGGFPVITAYIAQAHGLSWQVCLVAFACILYSMAQRSLSRQSRYWRRKVGMIARNYYFFGEVFSKARERPVLMGKDIFGPADLALKFMTWAVAAAAVGMLLK